MGNGVIPDSLLTSGMTMSGIHYFRRINNVEKDDVGRRVFLTPCLVTRPKKVSRHVSSDGLPDAPLCIGNCFPDVSSTIPDVFVHREIAPFHVVMLSLIDTFRS
uniref:Uncharacterized protein n=1 Tax=Cucumis melo TaxID=3656 RepID=A0A9I9CKB3_CUCME